MEQQKLPAIGRRPAASIGALVAALLLSAVATPAFAQTEPAAGTIEAIDVLVDRTRDEAGAIALSKELAAARDLTGAASVLEAFLIANPEALGARGEYATTLCMLDDMQAGRYEGSKLIAQGADAGVMAKVIAACGSVPAPTAVAAGQEMGQ